MKLIQRVIYAGFAAIAITSASMPVWPAPAVERSADPQRGNEDVAIRDVGIATAAVAGVPPAGIGFERR